MVRLHIPLRDIYIGFDTSFTKISFKNRRHGPMVTKNIWSLQKNQMPPSLIVYQRVGTEPSARPAGSQSQLSENTTNRCHGCGMSWHFLKRLWPIVERIPVHLSFISFLLQKKGTKQKRHECCLKSIGYCWCLIMKTFVSGSVINNSDCYEKLWGNAV